MGDGSVGVMYIVNGPGHGCTLETHIDTRAYTCLGMYSHSHAHTRRIVLGRSPVCKVKYVCSKFIIWEVWVTHRNGFRSQRRKVVKYVVRHVVKGSRPRLV